MSDSIKLGNLQLGMSMLFLWLVIINCSNFLFLRLAPDVYLDSSLDIIYFGIMTITCAVMLVILDKNKPNPNSYQSNSADGDAAVVSTAMMYG